MGQIVDKSQNTTRNESNTAYVWFDSVQMLSRVCSLTTDENFHNSADHRETVSQSGQNNCAVFRIPVINVCKATYTDRLQLICSVNVKD